MPVHRHYTINTLLAHLERDVMINKHHVNCNTEDRKLKQHECYLREKDQMMMTSSTCVACNPILNWISTRPHCFITHVINYISVCLKIKTIGGYDLLI